MITASRYCITQLTVQKEPEYDDNEEIALSKTRRKKDMHALQEIGEQLVELDPKKLTEFDLRKFWSTPLCWRAP